MERYIALINEPLIQTILALFGVLGSMYLAFRKVKKPDYSFHRERHDLVRALSEEFKCNEKSNIVIEELFSSLWNTKKITYSEIEFLMNLKSPKYFMNLYVKAKGYVELVDGEIQVAKKYGRHIDGLKKEEKSLLKFYLVMGALLALLLPTLLISYPQLKLSTILFFALLIFVLIAGMGIALFEVNKVYSSQRLIEETRD